MAKQRRIGKGRWLGYLGSVMVLALVFILAGCSPSPAPKTPDKGKPPLSPQALEHFRQSHRFLAEQKLDEALKEFQETARLAPDSALAYFWLGKAYMFKRDREQAEKTFLKTLEIDPKNYHAKGMMGRLYSMDREKLDQAQKYLQETLDDSPDNLEAHFDLGRIYAMKGERDKAMMEFRFLFTKEADFALYHFEMGRIQEAWGARDQARQHYQRALALNPRFEPATKAIKLLDDTSKAVGTPPAATPAPGARPPAR